MTHPAHPETNEIATAADLGRRAADAQHVDLSEYGIESAFGHLRRDDERLEVHDLELYCDYPRRARGDAILHNHTDFVAYVNRNASGAPDAATAWADQKGRRIVAVFNDHASSAQGGWRDHTATLALQVDPDWQAWIGRNGKLGGQVEFAEHIEDQLHTIVSPPAADMLEVAQTFTAHRNISFEQSNRLKSGEVQLRYVEQMTDAKAGVRRDIEVPETFTIRVSPYLGVEPVELTARLRYRIREGQLFIGYKLARPDLVEQGAFDGLRLAVAEGITVPLLLGTPPAALSR